MKNFLFCLLLLTGFACADSCIDLIAKSQTLAEQKGTVQDSSYFLEHGSNHEDNEWTHKYHWSDGKLDSIVYDSKEEGEAPEIIYFYWNVDESALRGKGAEQIYTQLPSSDTVAYTLRRYHNGNLSDSSTVKVKDSLHTTLSYSISVKEWTLEESYSRNDTLFHHSVYGYGSDKERPYTTFIVADPENEKKCLEYELSEDNPKLAETIEVVDTENGFMLKYLQGNDEFYYLREFFFVKDKEETTGIRKQRPAVKISPRAKYFDLLGRYKYSK